MLLSKSSEYSDVRLDDEEIIINHPGKRVCRGPWPYLPWVLAIFLSLLLIRNIWGQSEESKERRDWGSYEAGFATDIDQTRPLIRLKQVQFHGSFRVNDEGIWHLSRNDSEPVYVGKPSPEIDLAWDALIIPRFAGLYRDEAESLGLTLSGDDYEHDRIWIEPSGYHDLHCLNYIRRALDREYYTEIVFDRTTPVMPGMASDRLHLDHCIELLRQSLLCHMDLTPIPKRWLVNGNMLHADQDQMHTCRDAGPIHDWIDRKSISKNPA